MTEIGLNCGICEWVDGDGKTIARYPALLVQGKQFPQNQRELVKLLFQGNDVQNPACMYRREILSDIPGPFDSSLRMSCDWRFTLDVAHRVRIFGIPKVLVKMKRGKDHEHLWKDRDAGFHYTQRCLTGVYRDYKRHGAGITYFHYRKAMAKHLLWPYGWSTPPYKRLLTALFYDPTNKTAWKQLFLYAKRFMKSPFKRR
jgi:hypothetical protein